MKKTQKTKYYIGNICHQFADLHLSIIFPIHLMYRSSQRQCSLDLQLYKKNPTQVFSWEHCKIFKNTYIEKHLRTAASDCSYILLKKLNEIVQEPDCLSVLF